MPPFHATRASEILRRRYRTLVMGVINTTPDSFSDGGKFIDPEIAVASALQMIKDGADIIDVGGESTRPGSSPVDGEEELRRAIPVVRGICQANPDAVVSIDTRRSEVAAAAIEAGATIVNDITGFRDDPASLDVARDAGAGVVIMHMLGRPKTMQQEIHYDAFPDDIYRFLQERIEVAHGKGIPPDDIIIDPGIGFGKTFDQNLVLINRMSVFLQLGKPILSGPSRKSFLGKIIDQPVAELRDTATLGAIAASVLRGASIVRVHDVPRAVEVCKVIDAVLREQVF
ncbi:MAG: dihydropteroate synthase [Desulfomonilaceae bacterium]